MFGLIRNSVSTVYRLPVCFIKPIAKSHLTNRFCSATKKPPVETPLNSIIYEYVHPQFFRRINLLGVTQTIVFANFIQYYYVKVRTEVGDDETITFPFFEKHKFNMKNFQTGLLGLFGALALTISILVMVYTTRSIKYIVLRSKDRITLVTYTPLGKENAMTIPLKWVCGLRFRSKDESYLPLKIKNKRFYYLVDMRGTFHEPQVFDQIVNVKRTLH